MRSLFKTASTALVLLGTVCITPTAAQSCYYPNGNDAPDVPCSSNGGMCCPNGWECMSNGLCYNTGQDSFGNDLWGRYTCTDSTWQSESCPQICTSNNTAVGDESMKQCSDGSWCCNADGSVHCCDNDNAGTDFFSLPQGKMYATILGTSASQNAAAPTSLGTLAASGGSSQQPTSTSSSGSSTTSSATSSPSSTVSSSQTAASSSTNSQSSRASQVGPSTISSVAVTTNSDGSATTIVRYSTATVSAEAAATDQSSSASTHSSSSHLGLIVGLAVGIPVFLLACAIIACLFWRKRRANRTAGTPSMRSSEDQVVMSDKYGHQVGHVAPDGRAPEIDSYPVAWNRSSAHKSELEGSMHSPALSSLSGKPQGYSPISPKMGTVAEEPTREPAELWGSYVPYRPPRTELPGVPTA